MAHGEQTNPIRVLLANIHGLNMQFLNRLIEQETDMIVTGAARNIIELLTLIDNEVDVLILGVTDLSHRPGICSHLLYEYPHLRILAMMNNGDIGTVYWLGLREQSLQNISSATVLRYIRDSYYINPMI